MGHRNVAEDRIMKSLFLSPDVCTIEGFLSPAECESLVDASEGASYEAATVDTRGGPRMLGNLRNNDRVTTDDPVRAEWLWQRLRTAFPLEHRGAFRAVGVNERLRFYRYGPGQKFDWHRDGTFPRGDGATSRFTFMVYLNEACEGGETLFRDLPIYGDDGRSYPSELAVRPRTGMALLFHHPLMHKGDTVREGVKYVLRTDVMYRLIIR